MEPAGRRALVTGGGQGIGAAIAAALTRSGAHVSVAGRRAGPLEAAVARGDAAGFVVMDVTDETSIAEGLTAAGEFDILVNNAGAVETAPLARLDRAMWERMLAVNLTSVYAMTRAILPGMRARNWGRIVNIASTAGLRGYPYVAAYVAAKHGVVGLTRAVAMETARSGITVNAVCPGYADTDMLRASVAGIAARTGRGEDEVIGGFAAGNPQGRLVRPEEVAAAALFLCGPDAGAMTGQAIAVAGGEVM
jgi:NAD(P)-dependent dehydrogenase (short-subunit alcohol dehydrogenase family)